MENNKIFSIAALIVALLLAMYGVYASWNSHELLTDDIDGMAATILDIPEGVLSN